MLRCFVAIALLCAATQALACDVCGCSAGGFSSGFMTLKNQHFTGFQYSSRAFQSEHPTLFEDEVPTFSEERYQTEEWRARFFPIQNLQLMAFVPYHFFEKKEEGESLHTQGLGDITLTTHLVLFTKKDSSRFKQRLTAGGGVKLPTGNNQLSVEEGDIVIPNMQPGTGSLDFLINAAYMVQRKSWGSILEATYRINSANKEHYKFGNRFGTSLDIYRNQMLAGGKVLLRPQLGLAADFAASDALDSRKNEINEYSGGHVLESRFGLTTQWKNWVAGATYSRPINQSLGAGYITSRPKWTLQITYLIKTK